MSEKLQSSGEKIVDNIDAGAESRRNLERLKEAAEHAEKDQLSKHIESLAKSAEAQSISGQELNIGDQGTEQSAQHFGNSKELKADSFDRSIRKIRTKLNPSERVLSKVIHNRTVDTVSSAAAHSIARPSSLLGGGFGALLGSAILLYMSRQNGFTYNYSILLLMFVSGFFIGSIVELFIMHVLRRKSRRR